jgi:hypothetical protein
MLVCQKRSLSQTILLRRIELMKTRLTLILIFAGIFVVGTLAPATSQSITDKKLPEAHLFLHLFKHRDSLEKRTELVRQTGKDIDFTQWYEREAGLTPTQNEAFRSVASACLAEVEKLDGQAEEIIRQVRAQFPPGKTDRIPSVPPELLELQKKRDATVLRYRDELLAQLGDDASVRFKKFVEDKIQPNVKVLPPSQSQELSPPPGKAVPAYIDPKTPITGTLPRATTN